MIEKNPKSLLLEKVETGVPGFDLVTEGGIPKGRTTLVAGTSGSAKTVFAVQFLAKGAELGEAGVFVTFEESPEDIRENMMGLGWDIGRWEAEGNWGFVDASPQPGEEVVEAGTYDLGALLARIEHAIGKAGAKRASLDSLGAIFTQFADSAIVRRELFRIVSALKELGVTAIMTAERLSEYGDIARFGVEEFVSDNVIILRNVLEEERRRRTVEVLKFRGTTHKKGEYPFSVLSGEGIVVLPLSSIELGQDSTDVRVTSGNEVLDEMCGGGFFRDSIVLVSGATGTGKTLLSTEFMAGGCAQGERCLLMAFEESRGQLFRNAIGWGYDYQRMEEEGHLKLICEYPEVASLEEHLIGIRSTIEEFEPDRIVIDSLSALERVSTAKSFREFIIGLTSFVKGNELAGLLTATAPTLLGGESVTEQHISTLTDSIILLRYVEMFGEMRRGLAVLKMRGSMHDKEIREFTIDGTGMHIGRQFRNITGILGGSPTYFPPGEADRLVGLFEEEGSGDG